MRIALVNPVARRSEGYHTLPTRFPHLGLQVLARLVPPAHAVEIIDETLGLRATADLLTPRRYDLVGITAYTCSATRAYELAALCRQRGIPAVMGGPHAWAVPDEAARHFDSVAVGECDDVWPGIIADAAAGRLRARYEGRLADLAAGYGAADQTIKPVNGAYGVSCIQTSRGCPVGCDFCSVTRFSGRRIRRRPIDDIVAEWNSMRTRFVFVVDDNFFGVGSEHAAWSKRLLRELIRRGRKRIWFSQTSINMGADAEGLNLAFRAGCRAMLVGLESFDPETLTAYRKGLNRNVVEQYPELVDGFHRQKIAVIGCFVLGADNDTEEAVADTFLQAVQMGIDIIQITNLTPLPGTRLYERLCAEGRLLATNYPEDWERYSFTETVHRPARLSAARLDEMMREFMEVGAAHRWVLKRTLRTLWKTRSMTTAAFVHHVNRGLAGLVKRQAKRNADGRRPIEVAPHRERKMRRACGLFPGR